MPTGLKLNNGTEVIDFEDYFHKGNHITSTNSAGESSTLTIGENSTVSFKVPQFTVDKEGHITDLVERTVTITTGLRTCLDCNDYCNCGDNCDDCSSSA